MNSYSKGREAHLLLLLQHQNPLRPPHWRYEYLRHTFLGAAVVWSLETRIVRRYRRFLNNWEQGVNDPQRREAALQLDADLGGAHQLVFACDQEPRRQLEAWLLTGESLESIAARTGLDPEVIDCFEHFFYDVREHLEAYLWIQKHVLTQPANDGPNPNRLVTNPVRWRMYRQIAYHGGPVALETILRGVPPTRMPQRIEDVGKCFDTEFGMVIQLLAGFFVDDIPNNFALVRRALKRDRRSATRSDGRDETLDARLAKYLAPILASMKGIPPDRTGR